jgi:hypothetical protein
MGGHPHGPATTTTTTATMGGHPHSPARTTTGDHAWPSDDDGGPPARPSDRRRRRRVREHIPVLQKSALTLYRPFLAFRKCVNPFHSCRNPC